MEREYSKRRNAGIEKELGRSASAVRNRAQHLGLKKPPEFFEMSRRQKEAQELKADIRINPLGKNELVPQMLGLFDHLMSMSGCMATEIPDTTTRRAAYLKRVESVKPQIKEMLRIGVTGHKIADQVGLPRGTVYDYIKAIRAAA